MKRLPEAQYLILAELSPHTSLPTSGTHSALVCDATDNRWYLYRYVDNIPKNYTPARTRDVNALIKKGLLQRVMMDAAGAFEVYALTDAGKEAWTVENLRRSHAESR